MSVVVAEKTSTSGFVSEKSPQSVGIGGVGGVVVVVAKEASRGVCGIILGSK